MYKILQIMGGANAGGISAVVYNYMKHLDKSKFSFDFVLNEKLGMIGKKMMELGANCFYLPMKSKDKKAYKDGLIKILSENHYDAIHVHESYTSFVALRIAKKIGIKVRVAHAHTSAPTYSLLGEIKRCVGIILNYHYATKVMGCGKLAGERVFGKINMKRKKACVLPNAIDTQKFSFNKEIRNKIRNELKLKDNFVIGTVGRFSSEKNPFGIIEIFKFVHDSDSTAKLLWVGDGDLRPSIEEKIRENNLEDSVILTGVRSDVNELFQAMDVFILPSFSEGLGLVAVEAQASGLPCVLSTGVPNEADLTGNCKFIPLENKEEWRDTILSLKDFVRENTSNMIIEKGYDIKSTSKWLENFYLGLVDKKQ